MQFKLKSFIIILFTFVYTQCYAQDFWEQLYFPDSASIKCISINTQGHIFIGTGAYSENGILYRTMDNAQTWEVIFNNGTLSVSCIDINENGKIFIGKNGPESIVMSEDNGQTWEVAELPDVSFGNVMKILCQGNNTVYASLWGSNGPLIAFTVDAGITWEYCYINSESNAYISDIDLISTGELFVSTTGWNTNTGGVYKSIDGGYTWEYMGLSNHQIQCIESNTNDEIFTGDWDSFLPETSGIFALLEGQTEFVKITDGYHITDIAISDENEIFVAGNNSIFRSNNNGETFQNIPDENSQGIKNLYIDQYSHLYGINENKLVRSIEPLITNINTISKDNISIYPNPSRDYINIEVPTTIAVPFLLEITNIHGKLVYARQIQEGSKQLNIQELPIGIYFLGIKSSKNFYQSKFIKQ